TRHRGGDRASHRTSFRSPRDRASGSGRDRDTNAHRGPGRAGGAMNAFEVLDREGPIPNEIRKLESRLWRRTRKDGLKVLMFTSALQGEGKSTTTAFFAAATALHRTRKV